MGTMSQWSAAEIHLPQLLNEEASADEFSRWEQVSSVAAERFVHRHLPPPALSHLLPSALFPIIHSIPQPTPSPSSPKSDVSSTPRSPPAEPAQNPADAFPHAARSILPYQ